MKKTIKNLSIILSVLLFASCNNNDDSNKDLNNNQTNNIEVIENKETEEISKEPKLKEKSNLKNTEKNEETELEDEDEDDLEYEGEIGEVEDPDPELDSAIRMNEIFSRISFTGKVLNNDNTPYEEQPRVSLATNEGYDEAGVNFKGHYASSYEVDAGRETDGKIGYFKGRFDYIKPLYRGVAEYKVSNLEQRPAAEVGLILSEEGPEYVDVDEIFGFKEGDTVYLIDAEANVPDEFRKGTVLEEKFNLVHPSGYPEGDPNTPGAIIVFNKDQDIVYSLNGLTTWIKNW